MKNSGIGGDQHAKAVEDTIELRGKQSFTKKTRCTSATNAMKKRKPSLEQREMIKSLLRARINKHSSWTKCFDICPICMEERTNANRLYNIYSCWECATHYYKGTMPPSMTLEELLRDVGDHEDTCPTPRPHRQTEANKDQKKDPQCDS